MTRIVLITILSLLATLHAAAQTDHVQLRVHPEDREVNMDDPTFVPMVKVGKALDRGDSIQYVELNPVYCYPTPVFKNAKQRAAYNRLVYNVKKVLPWAKLAKLTIVETYDFLETLPDKQSRDEHVKRVEAGLKKQYGPALKKMTRSQGRLLVKLVNRECNQTGYNIAKAFMGTYKANLYQSVALLFGNSLTKKYDPEGDDQYTERVVRMVEAGQL